MYTPEDPGAGRTLWRVFPWEATAREGRPFSPTHVPLPTGRGRFDLPRELSSVLYLAETPEHAIAESLQRWRGQPVRAHHLRRAGFPLALVPVDLPHASFQAIIDLCDPEELSRLETRPDLTASLRRDLTQPVARAVWDRGGSGVRWWSSFSGDWHTVVLFTRRTPELAFGRPEALTADQPTVRSAADLLGMPTA